MPARPIRRLGLLAGLALVILAGAPATAQQGDTERLRLGDIVPGGVRDSATTSWGAYRAELTNFSDRDRVARVLVSYGGRPNEQYGRDVWLPAHSVLKTWLLVGPVAQPPEHGSLDVQAQVYDRSGGADPAHLPPGDERRSGGALLRGTIYRDRKDVNTAVLLDEDPPAESPFGRLPEPPTRIEEALDLVRTFRSARRMASGLLTRIAPGGLPPTPQAFQGIDHFVVATSAVANDPVGLRALRRWLEQGGTVWVMLDLVDPEAVAPLLGDGYDFRLADRVSLSTATFERHPPEPQPPGWRPPQYERPVEFARVLLPRGERVLYTVNGWPAWFSREVGRGKVVFTTLGPRAWTQERTRNSPPSPYENFPLLPLSTPPLDALADEISPTPVGTPFNVETFRPLLAEEIGYSVVSRTTLAAVFAAFVAGTLGLGLVLRRTRRPELLGWVAPAAALAATGAFLAIGEASRRAAPPTVAVVQLVDAAASHGEAPVHGLLAAYRPDSGSAEVGPRHGGFFDLDLTGVEDQPHRLILTDLDSWHWEDLGLPAGVRMAPFQYTAATGAPISAVARLGPDGLEGRLDTGPFRNPGDALLSTVNGRNMAVRLGPDGSFRSGGEDILPAGQFLAGAVLTDRQQRRQKIYRDLLQRTALLTADNRNVLYAWADPIDMDFNLAPGAQTVGSALLTIPLRLERPAAGERVTVPGPLVPYRRVMDSGLSKATLESDQHADQHLRFQLPAAVLPFRVERARLVGKIDAPGRRVTVAGLAGTELVELHHADSPLDPIRVEIADERLLRLDDDGGLHLNLDISAPLGGQQAGALGVNQKWTIEYLELEVVGRAE
jgi:hypothetical protein